MSDQPNQCPVCGYPGSGPSDHEPWCPCFMAGPIDLEGQMDLLTLLGADDD